MNIAVVDTNPARRKELVTTLKSMYPTDSFAIFSDTASVIDYVGKNPTDAVFAECNMQPIDGIVLRNKLHIINPKLRVIISDDNNYEEISEEDIILVRPITPKKIKKCMIR